MSFTLLSNLIHEGGPEDSGTTSVRNRMTAQTRQAARSGRKSPSITMDETGSWSRGWHDHWQQPDSASARGHAQTRSHQHETRQRAVCWQRSEGARVSSVVHRRQRPQRRARGGGEEGNARWAAVRPQTGRTGMQSMAARQRASPRGSVTRAGDGRRVLGVCGVVRSLVRATWPTSTVGAEPRGSALGIWCGAPGGTLECGGYI